MTDKNKIVINYWTETVWKERLTLKHVSQQASWALAVNPRTATRTRIQDNTRTIFLRSENKKSLPFRPTQGERGGLTITKDFVTTCVSTNVKKPLPYAAPRPPLFLNNFKDPLSRFSQKPARAWNLLKKWAINWWRTNQIT